MNCLFFELQCNFTHPLYQSDEFNYLNSFENGWKRLHQSEQLAGKLYDVQWRIVKSVNGFYSVHAIMYVIGDEYAKYSDFYFARMGRYLFTQGA